MTNELDTKAALSQKIKLLSASDTQKLKIFLAGMEAAKAIQPEVPPITEEKNEP